MRTKAATSRLSTSNAGGVAGGRRDRWTGRRPRDYGTRGRPNDRAVENTFKKTLFHVTSGCYKLLQTVTEFRGFIYAVEIKTQRGSFRRKTTLFENNVLY